MRKPVLTSLVIGSLLLTACSGKPAASPQVPPPASSQQEPAPTQPPASSDGQTGQPNTPTTPNPEPPKPVEEPPKPVKREMPQPVRGIHLSGWYAGDPSLYGPLFEWGKQVGINTLILDIKAEDGYLSWESDIPLAKEIGSNRVKIADLPKFIAEAHDNGFWVAGRIVVMNDQWLYQARPEWGIPGFSGGAYSFMDPKNENVWQYNIDIAKAAVAAGVDEIQWDYIRYPEKWVDGYNRDTTAEYRTGHINNFLKKSVEELKPLGVVVGADLFGLTTSVTEGDDMKIGQDYRKVAEIVDYVAAMAYPSHYDQGTYGIANPNAAPYETVKGSMSKALERTPGLPIEKHRPWIQDFSIYGISYGPAEVMAQVKALEELGIHSFMLWDPNNKYSRDVNFKD